MSIQRKTLVDLHLIVGSFIIPVCLLFAITGSLYTFGIKGDYKSQSEVVTLPEALSTDLVLVQSFAEKLLKEKNIPFPTGSSGIKKVGTSWQFEWTGSKLDLVIDPTENPLEYKVNFKETSWHRSFVQLHKAKGGVVFKVFAALFSLGLICLLLTGWLMANANPRLRKIRDYSYYSGVIIFVLAVLFS
jgi:uncharacterized iron-regulated membrane protein